MRSVLMAGILLLLMPSAASAATVAQGEDKGFVYTAAPGETNVPAVTRDRSARTLTIADPGATITATAPCTVAGGVATCRTGKFVRLDMQLADGDDTLVFDDDFDEPGDNVLDKLDLGTGADTAEVSAYTLVGGDGDDRLVNKLGKVSGGDGDDELTATSSFSSGSVLSGGPGNDVLHGEGDFRSSRAAPGRTRSTAGPRPARSCCSPTPLRR